MIGRTLPVTLLALVLTTFFTTARADTTGLSIDNLFHRANAAYAGGDYHQAITLYEELLVSDGYAPNVLFNLGNSYAQTGQTGRAVLNYERALRLAPDDADLQGNLQLLRRDKGLFAEEGQGWQPFQLLSLDRWSLLALACLMLLAMWQVAALKSPWARTWRLAASLSCLAVLSLSTTGIVDRYQSFNPSVVIADDARLLLSPFTSSASVGAIQEGRLVAVEKRHGDYLYVTDENGRRGWISATQLEPVRK